MVYFPSSMKASPPTEPSNELSAPVIKKEPGSEVRCSSANHWRSAGNYHTDYRAAAVTCADAGCVQQPQFENDVHATSLHNMAESFHQAVMTETAANLPPRLIGRHKPRLTWTKQAKGSWGDEQKRRTELIIELRSKEWKARQAMWKSGMTTGYHPEFNPTTAQFVAQRPSGEVIPYNYEPSAHHYSMVSDEMCYGPPRSSFEGMSPQGPVQVQMRSPTLPPPDMMSNGDQPVIKNVVSLANGTKEENDDPPSQEPVRRRAKRPRASFEEPESSDSGTSEADDSSSAGKYISDLARPFTNIPDDHQVAHINGLLSLPSNRDTRYGITYGELKRRCNPPESLTRVDLVAYVRHSKSSGRNLLDKYRIVSANRNSRSTILSKMCENEARVLGDGILKMNTEFFPGKQLAIAASSKTKAQVRTEKNAENSDEKVKNAVKDKMHNIETTRSMLKEVYDILLSAKDTEEMKEFQLASHTFGTTNLMNHLTLFDRFFEEYQNQLSSKNK